MNWKQVARKTSRRGITLLEMVIASSMLALVLTSISVVMRSGRGAWEAHEADFIRIQAAHATVRHLVRNVRQADEVVAVSASTDNSGSISLLMQDGDTLVWDHDSGTNQVNFGVTSATNLLAPDITGLRFEGFEADGVTPTTVDVQCLRIEVTFDLPVATNPQRTVSSWAWVRTW